MFIVTVSLSPTHTHTPGPSVLDVFRTLVKHLRISIETSVEVSYKFDRAP